MWEALGTCFKGKGLSQLNKCIDEYMLLNLEDSSDLQEYATDFKENIRKLEEMKKTDIKHWHCYRFIQGVSKTYKLQGYNQRTKLRQQEELPENQRTINLQLLIDDLIDKACTQSQSTGRSTYYGNKTLGQAKDKPSGKDSQKKPCKHCKEKRPCHKEEDCFVLPLNKEKKLAWEKKFDKKHIPYKDRKRDNTSNNSNNSKDENYSYVAREVSDSDDLENDEGVMGKAYSGYPTYKSINLVQKDRFIADLGADDHITYDYT